MKENIYTIPVNEAFDKSCGCPLCRLHDDLEKNEIDRITGPAMMEPDVRIETNKHGFCQKHLEMMRVKNAVLSLALTLETHVAERTNDYSLKPGSKPKAILQIADLLRKKNEDCYICSRIEKFFLDEVDTVFRLYKKDEAFRNKLKNQEFYCQPHAELLIRTSVSKLSASDAATFSTEVMEAIKKYLTLLQSDLNWFCSKFDYRNANADWKNSKDSIERAIATLTGTVNK